MSIGDQIRKYRMAKAAAAQAEAELRAQDVEVPEVEGDDLAALEGELLLGEAPPAVTAVEQPPQLANVLQQMAALMEQLVQAKTSGSAPQQDAAYKQIELIEQLITKTHPENVDHPGKSVYSYPEGDVARPKPALQCKIFWVGYDLRTETLTPIEIELLNRLKPGEYRVTKADGLNIPFRVIGVHSDKLNDQGQPTLERLEVWFPCKNEARQNHLSMVSYLQQALGDKIPSTVELLAELAKMKAELAAARAGVVGVV